MRARYADRPDQCRRSRGTVPSDSTHGLMADFELVALRVLTADGLEGRGYTYTVGRGGRAIELLIRHDLAESVVGWVGAAALRRSPWRRESQRSMLTAALPSRPTVPSSAWSLDWELLEQHRVRT